MKNLMTTLILTLTAFTALADLPEVKLDKNKIELATNQVVVVRTAATPEKVKFEMSVPITRTECLAYDTRQVYGPDSSCGYYTEPVTRCDAPMAAQIDLLATPECHEVCNSSGCHQTCYEREHPGNGGGDYDHDHDRHTCRTEYVQRVASCYHSETYCSAYGPVTNNESRKIKLVFKDLTPLKEGETEKFILKGEQGGHRLVYDTKFTLEVKDSLRKYSVKEGAFYFLDPRLVVKQLP